MFWILSAECLASFMPLFITGLFFRCCFSWRLPVGLRPSSAHLKTRHVGNLQHGKDVSSHRFPAFWLIDWSPKVLSLACVLEIVFFSEGYRFYWWDSLVNQKPAFCRFCEGIGMFYFIVFARNVLSSTWKIQQIRVFLTSVFVEDSAGLRPQIAHSWTCRTDVFQSIIEGSAKLESLKEGFVLKIHGFCFLSFNRNLSVK